MSGSLAMSGGPPMAGSLARAGRALREDTGKSGKAAVLPITGRKNGDFLFYGDTPISLGLGAEAGPLRLAIIGAVGSFSRLLR